MILLSFLPALAVAVLIIAIAWLSKNESNNPERSAEDVGGGMEC